MYIIILYMTWSGSGLAWQRAWIVALCIWLNVIRTLCHPACLATEINVLNVNDPQGKGNAFPPQIFRIVHCSFCVGCSWYFRLFSESEHGIETAKLNTMLGLHEQSEGQLEASITWINKEDGISPAFSRHRKQVLSEFLLQLKIMSLKLVITYYGISNWERRHKEIEGLEIRNKEYSYVNVGLQVSKMVKKVKL